MKRYTFRVPADIRETKLFALVKRMLPELPDYVIRQAFDKRDVKAGGARVGKDAWAVSGADIELYTPYAALETTVQVLYEDGNVLVVRKPAGVSCEADEKGGKTIAEWVGEWLQAKDPAAPLPLMCHRLDNQTEGLLLLAKGEEAQRELIRAFQQGQIHKEYACLVKGAPKPPHRTLEAYLLKDAALGRVRVISGPAHGARSIKTEYEVVEAGEVSRLRVTLYTGRTHQIRAQMAAIGHPVLGDDWYGDRAFNRRYKAKRLMLCAVALSFSIAGALEYLNAHRFVVEPFF